MRAMLGKNFGPADVGANISSGTDKKQTQPQEDELDSLRFYTIVSLCEFATFLDRHLR